jgi:hypothetical protein
VEARTVAHRDFLHRVSRDRAETRSQDTRDTTRATETRSVDGLFYNPGGRKATAFMFTPLELEAPEVRGSSSSSGVVVAPLATARSY